MTTVSHRINVDGVFYQSVDMPLTTLEVTGLEAGRDYLITVQGVDDEGGIGPQSDPVTIATLETADITAPVISSVVVTQSHDQVTIAWITDEPSDSRVNFGITEAYGGTQFSANLVTSHSLTIPNLFGDTTYQFQIVSSDASGNEGTSTNTSFTTDPVPDTAAPTITNVASAPTESTSVITWTTSEPATSVVSYGSSQSYGQTETVPGTRTSHNVTLSDLDNNQLYNFRVTSSDVSNNSSNSANQTFTTLYGTPAIPVLNDASSVTADGFDISCQAVGGATSYEIQVDDVTIQNTANTTYQARDMLANTAYTFRVRAINSAANTPVSGWSSAKTVTTDPTQGPSA